MKNPVKLKCIIEELEIQFDESRTFLNMETGEIITFTSDEIRAAEEDESFEHLPHWQQEDIKAAIEVIENFENYIELPTKYDVNEYEIMEDFCLSLSDQRKRDVLSRAIKGKGAFRRFKDEIIGFDIEDQWYSYRNNKFKDIAIEWCQENNLNYVD